MHAISRPLLQTRSMATSNILDPPFLKPGSAPVAAQHTL